MEFSDLTLSITNSKIAVEKKIQTSCLESVIFVALDFEFHRNKKRASNQMLGPWLVDEVGVATLNTRDLFKLSPLPSDGNNIVSSESRRIPQHNPLQRSSFLFGVSNAITRDELEEYLTSKILIKDENGGYRNNIIVGQEFRAERLAMKRIGIELYDYERYPSVVEILDTRLLSYLVLQKRPEFTYNTSLDGLLESFGVFHFKGNICTLLATMQTSPLRLS